MLAKTQILVLWILDLALTIVLSHQQRKRTENTIWGEKKVFESWLLNILYTMIYLHKWTLEWVDLIVLCNEEQSSFVQEPVETFQNTLEINWVELTQDHFHWNSTASCKYESSLGLFGNLNFIHISVMNIHCPELFSF